MNQKKDKENKACTYVNVVRTPQTYTGKCFCIMFTKFIFSGIFSSQQVSIKVKICFNKHTVTMVRKKKGITF